MPERYTIPARSGAATYISRGQTVRVINTHGHQVVDTWAFAVEEGQATSQTAVEYMSMCHTRAALLALRPSVGSTLVSNCRRPMLTLTRDTSPGVHDTLIAACDIYRYQQLLPDLKANNGYHNNCSDNLSAGLLKLSSTLDGGIKAKFIQSLQETTKGWTPDPLNLFMNIPWASEPIGHISFESTRSKPGDFVELRAERDVVVVMSACPQDILSINGKDPVEAHFEVSR